MNKGKMPDPKEAQQFFRSKVAFTTGPLEVMALFQEKAEFQLLDVRSAEDFALGHLPGAIHFPIGSWSDTEVLSKQVVNIFYGFDHASRLAAKAAYKFAALGYPVMELEGGFRSWLENDLKVESNFVEREGAGRAPALGALFEPRTPGLH